MLSGCYHFPSSLLPLYIFEERYRAMLGYALDGGRMFGVGVRVDDDGMEDALLPVVTAGLVSACVKNADGTAHLALLGLKRMRITGFVSRKPFPIAQVVPMPTVDAGEPGMIDLMKAAINALPSCPKGAEETMNRLKCHVSEGCDPERACDILTYHFVRDPAELAESLQEPSLRERYRILLDALKQKA